MTSNFVVPSGQVTNVTVAPEVLHHYITDGELEQIGRLRKEPVAEICLATTGASLGSLIPACQEISRFNYDNAKFTGWSLAIIALTGITLFAAMITGYLWHMHRDENTSTVKAIRDRPRVPVGQA